MAIMLAYPQAQVVALALDCPTFSEGVLNFNLLQIQTATLDRPMSIEDMAEVIRRKSLEGWGSCIM